MTITRHNLSTRARRLVRLGINRLMDEYDKIAKSADEKLDDQGLRSAAKSTSRYLMSLRLEFAEPGDSDETLGKQREMFAEDNPFQSDLEAELALGVVDDVKYLCPKCDGYVMAPPGERPGCAKCETTMIEEETDGPERTGGADDQAGGRDEDNAGDAGPDSEPDDPGPADPEPGPADGDGDGEPLE